QHSTNRKSHPLARATAAQHCARAPAAARAREEEAPMSNARRLALILAIMVSATANLSPAPAMAQTEPVEFERWSVVSFDQPTMSCPDSFHAGEAHKHDAKWLASRGCKNLDPHVKEWLVVRSGASKVGGRVVYTEACVFPLEQVKEVHLGGGH